MSLGDVLGLVFIAAAVMLLVRPGSPAAELVDSLGAMFTAMIRSATDLAA